MDTPVRLERIFTEPSPADGARVLVDRLWPRGVSRARAALDAWLKEVAPSTELRRWYDHRPDRLAQFRARYLEELATVPAAVEALGELRRLAEAGQVTLLTATREVDISHLPILRDLLTGPRPG